MKKSDQERIAERPSHKPAETLSDTDLKEVSGGCPTNEIKIREKDLQAQDRMGNFDIQPL